MGGLTKQTQRISAVMKILNRTFEEPLDQKEYKKLVNAIDAVEAQDAILKAAAAGFGAVVDKKKGGGGQKRKRA